jgi:hypothetical protein
MITPKKERKPRPYPKTLLNKRTTKTPWIRVAALFVQGIIDENAKMAGRRRWPTLAELARMYKVNESTVSLHAREEKWMAQRLAFQRELRAQEDTQLVQELAGRRVRCQVAFASMGQQLQHHINRHLRIDPRRPDALVDPKTLQRLGATLRNAQSVVEVAMGHPADGEGSGGGHGDWIAFINVQATPPVQQILDDLDADDLPTEGVVSPQRGLA